MPPSFARSNNGLDTLLAALAQRESATQASEERKLQREQLMLNLEQMKQNAVLAKDQIALESKKADASIELQKVQMELSLQQHRAGMISQEANLKQLEQGMAFASRAEARAQKIHDETLRRNASSEAWERISNYRAVLDGINQELEGRIPREIANATAALGESNMAIMETFGNLIQTVEDGVAVETFVPHPMYEAIFEQLAKSDKKQKISYKDIAIGWVNKIKNSYGAKEKQAVARENQRRAASGERPISSILELGDPVIKAGLVNEAMSEFFMGTNGPIAQAAIKAMGTKNYERLLKEYGGDANMAATAAATSFRFDGTRVKFGDVSETFGPSGTRHMTNFATQLYGTFRGTLDDVIPKLYSASSVISGAEAKAASLREARIRQEALIDGEQQMVMTGHPEGLTPEKSRALLGFIEPSIQEANNPVNPETGEPFRFDDPRYVESVARGSVLLRDKSWLEENRRFLAAENERILIEQQKNPYALHGLNLTKYRMGESLRGRVGAVGSAPAIPSWMIKGPALWGKNIGNYFSSQPQEGPEEMLDSVPSIGEITGRALTGAVMRGGFRP